MPTRDWPDPCGELVGDEPELPPAPLGVCGSVGMAAERRGDTDGTETTFSFGGEVDALPTLLVPNPEGVCTGRPPE